MYYASIKERGLILSLHKKEGVRKIHSYNLGNCQSTQLSKYYGLISTVLCLHGSSNVN